VNLDWPGAAAALSAPSPDLVRANAALGAQLVGLGLALVRLERVRAHAPAAQPGPDWRGAAQSAYQAGVHGLCRELDEATDAVRTARRLTARALAEMASRA
jgi:hypothetical protein